MTHPCACHPKRDPESLFQTSNLDSNLHHNHRLGAEADASFHSADNLQRSQHLTKASASQSAGQTDGLVSHRSAQTLVLDLGRHNLAQLGRLVAHL